MSFNELNSVEHFIIQRLTGLDLNTLKVSETLDSYGLKWVYKSSSELQRSVNEVLVETELKDALIRLNSEIKARPELADKVIYKLRAILISVNQVGLVKANENFFKWMTGEKTIPFGENNGHVPIRLIDFENVSRIQEVNLC
jgi:type I restriction enzyme R subunit